MLHNKYAQNNLPNMTCHLQLQLLILILYNWHCMTPSVNIVLIPETRGLFNNVWRVWLFWRMSFKDLCLFPFAPSMDETSQSWGRIFKALSSGCLISPSSVFLPFRPSFKTMLQFWPHFLNHFLPFTWTLLLLHQHKWHTCTISLCRSLI